MQTVNVVVIANLLSSQQAKVSWDKLLHDYVAGFTANKNKTN